MARWIFSVMAAALLAMLVWSVWWWAGWQSDGYTRGMGQVSVGCGEIFFELLLYDPPLDPAAAAIFASGFLYGRHDEGVYWWPVYEVSRAGNEVQRIVIIPIWMPLVLFAGAAGYFWRRHARRRRRERIIKAGGCPNCGYDLRGLRAQDEAQGEKTEPRAVCPECGGERGGQRG